MAPGTLESPATWRLCEEAKKVLARVTEPTITECLRDIQLSYADNDVLRLSLSQFFSSSVADGIDKVMQSIAIGSGGQPPPADSGTGWVLSPGERCEHYRVIKPIGAGGMGQVYLAEDEKLRCLRALKTLSSTFVPSAAVRERLNQEVFLVAKLPPHVNVAGVYDYIEHRALPIVVMEYVEGKTLLEVLREGAVPLKYALRVAKELTEAVEVFQERRVWHCDLKPANVIITNDGKPKILDFGLAIAAARAAQSPDAPAESSRPMPIMGTPPYMAPERLKSGGLSNATDVYSLGVIIFEMLTRTRPFDESNMTRLVVDVMCTEAPKPSSFVPGLPGKVDSLVGRALEKSPDHRSRASDLRRAIEDAYKDIVPTPWWIVCSIALAATFISVVLAGGITTLVYSGSLFTSGFDGESPLRWPYWGVRSMIAPVAGFAVVLAGCSVLTATCRLINGISAAPRTWVQSLHQRVRPLIRRTRLDHVSTQMEWLFALHMTTLVVLMWRFWDLFDALGNLTLSAGPIWVLGPQNLDALRTYRKVFSLVLFTSASVWAWLLIRHRDSGVAIGWAAAARVLILMAVTTALLAAPYRIVYQNDAERVTYKGQKCFLIAERGDDRLLFCPSQPPPWTRVVKLNDPDVQREYTFGNIFENLGPSNSPSN